jgi:hypothetical protein
MKLAAVLGKAGHQGILLEIEWQAKNSKARP